MLFSFFSILNAQDNEYKWSAFINKKSAYINEAVYLKYTCEFQDRGELYVIEFMPKSTERFEIVSLSQTHEIHDSKRIQTYEYIVFPTLSGRVDFDFDVIMKKTNKDSIENTVLGRDNAQFEEYTIQKIKQKKLSLEVKGHNSRLVGSFRMTEKKDTPKLKAYEPYHLRITIKGIGDFEALKSIDFSAVDAKVFADEPQTKFTLTKNGYEGTWSQKFAFVASKNFSIPSLQVKYFDPHDAKLKVLNTKAIDVEVTPAYTAEELLDVIDDEHLKFKKEYLYYLLSFIAGFLLAKINFSQFYPKDEEEDTFSKKVKKSKTLEELHMLLVLQDGRRYKEIVADIESTKLTTLNQVKKLLEN